jgi:serine/threonine-protein kinase
MASLNGRVGGGPGPQDPLLGRIVADRYRLVRKVEARGGAALYRAQHLFGDRPVAVALLDAAGASPTDVDRFLEDARTVARVGHENVVEIYKGGRVPEDRVFLAMEPLEGASLAQVIAREGPLLWERAQGIVLQLAAALGAVHRHGVAHGDLRADAVLVVPRAGRRDFVKLADFGVARLRAAAGSGASDPRDDVRALGALTYEMVTGRAPFGPHRGADAAVPPPSTLRPAGTLPADFDAVVARALEADPERRWPDMAAFADAVARCRLTRRQSVRVEALAMAELSGKPDAFEVDARKRRRARAIASVAAGVAIAIAVLGLVKTSPGHVSISTVPSDADLTFNGLPVKARSPVVLDAAPGRYKLLVSRAGYLPAERVVEVAASETVSVPVELAVAPAAAPAAAVPEAVPAGAAANPPPGVEDTAPAAAPSP